MNYDIDMCDGMVGNDYCPLRENCKRWVLGQRALAENFPPTTPYLLGLSMLR